jgi:hypothetical protein
MSVGKHVFSDDCRSGPLDRPKPLESCAESHVGLIGCTKTMAERFSVQPSRLNRSFCSDDPQTPFPVPLLPEPLVPGVQASHPLRHGLPSYVRDIVISQYRNCVIL